MHERKFGANAWGRFDIGAGIIVMLVDSRRHSEDIGIKDDVFGREADPVDENVVGTPADGKFSFRSVRLALLVEGHDDDGGAVTQDLPRLRDEQLLAFLQADRIDDRLSLYDFQSRFDDAPF